MRHTPLAHALTVGCWVAAATLLGCRSEVSLGDGRSQSSAPDDVAGVAGATGTAPLPSPASEPPASEPPATELPMQDAGTQDPPLGEFGLPRLIAELSDPTALDDDPMLSADGLEIYFSSTRLTGNDATADIFRSTRASLLAAWQPPELVTELSSPSNESGCALSQDALTIYFNSTRPADTLALNIWVSERATRDSPWTEPSFVPELNTDADEVVRSLAPDGLIMMLARRTETNYDIFQLTRSSVDTPWGAAVALDTLNTESQDASPYLVTEPVVVFFSSNRPGAAGSDIYQSSRESSLSAFDPPQLVLGVNTASNDVDPWVSSDQRMMVFASDRQGAFDLFDAQR